MDNWVDGVTSIRVITLFSLSPVAFHGRFLHFILRIYSRNSGFIAVFFFCLSGFFTILPLSSLYLVSISLIFLPFINYNLCCTGNDNNPAAAWRELLMWNQNAHHVPAHQKQAVLACSSVSQETLRTLGNKAFQWLTSKWNIKLKWQICPAQDWKWSSISWQWNTSVWVDVVILSGSITWWSVSK